MTLPKLLGNLLLAFALLPALTLPLHAQQPAGGLEEQEELAFKQAAALVSPSLVRIQTVGGLERIGEMLVGTGPTTGVVVSADGHIVSSSFNFAAKPASVLVTLLDGRRFPATIVASDHLHMLTLLKIDAAQLVPAQAAPRQNVRVGQWAIALGRTFDSPQPNVSVGIVSSLNRVWGKAIQTDAKVSPANYGGPLVDVAGRVMGILVPLAQQGSGETAGVEWYDSGIGFAIPMQEVYAIADRLKQGSDLHPGLLGITLKGADLYSGEATVDRVRYNSPAQKAGLKPGDVIVEVDGRKVARLAQLKDAMGNKLAGDSVSVVARRGDEQIKADITLVAELQPYESAFLGILPAREGVATDGPPGVGVRYVYADSPAARAGLKPRDRIVRFNDAEAPDAATLADLVSRQLPAAKATVVFKRDGEEQTAELELASIPNAIPSELLPVAIPSVERPAAEPAKAKDANEATDAPGAQQKPDDTAPQTGRFTGRLEAHEHSYWAYVPDDYNPAFRYALMVWIHPGGDTMEAALYSEWKSLCDRRGTIILAPRAAQISGWTPNEAEFVKEAVEQFTAQYSIDPGRVFLHSYSDGSPFAFLLAFRNRELFRGVAAAGAPLRMRPPDNEPDARLQFHFICGANDNLHPLVGQSVEALRKLKFPVSFSTVKDDAHKYPPAEQLDELARWADALDRI